MSAPLEVPLDQLDLSRWVRSGDTVLWGQSSAEPVPLTRRLMAQRLDIGPIRCVIGLTESDSLQPEHADVVTFVSYCGSGANRALERAGVLEILPSHYSALPWLDGSGAVSIDVLFLLLCPADADGGYRLAVSEEYLSAAIDGARVVVAEVSDRVPRTCGGRVLRPEDIDVIVRTSRAPISLTPREPSVVERTIARHVAAIVPDGATLQFGIGSLPTALLGELTGHRDLGVHSGMLCDAVVDLAERGSITGARKSRDRGIIVAGTLMGSPRLFDFVDGNPAVHLRDTGYTHAPDVLAAQERFVALNSALEVDLTGQVNTEVALGTHLGAVGGIVDFIRGAHRSRGGLPIIALPSVAGPHSRVVTRLTGPVSMSRSDAGLVVTEHGVADLRGLTLSQRRERMLAIAHPDHQARLEEELRWAAPLAAGEGKPS